MYCLRTVERAGYSLVLNNITGFWQALLMRNLFSVHCDPLNERRNVDERITKELVLTLSQTSLLLDHQI